MYAFNTPIIMSGNNANNFYGKKNVPGVFSKETVGAIRKGVGASERGRFGGM